MNSSEGSLRSLKVSEIVLVRIESDYTEVLTSRGVGVLVHKTIMREDAVSTGQPAATTLAALSHCVASA